MKYLIYLKDFKQTKHFRLNPFLLKKKKTSIEEMNLKQNQKNITNKKLKYAIMAQTLNSINYFLSSLFNFPHFIFNNQNLFRGPIKNIGCKLFCIIPGLI